MNNSFRAMSFYLKAFSILSLFLTTTYVKGQSMPDILDSSTIEVIDFEFLGRSAIQAMEESQLSERMFTVVLRNNTAITIDYLTCGLRIYSNDKLDEWLYTVKLQAPVAMQPGQVMKLNCRSEYSNQNIKMLKNLADKFGVVG